MVGIARSALVNMGNEIGVVPADCWCGVGSGSTGMCGLLSGWEDSAGVGRECGNPELF